MRAYVDQWAAHEAGHTVVAVVLGAQPAAVTLMPYHWIVRFYDDWAGRDIRILAAGVAAERLLGWPDAYPYGRELERLNRSGISVETAIHLAKYLLRSNLPIVLAVAEFLAKSRRQRRRKVVFAWEFLHLCEGLIDPCQP